VELRQRTSRRSLRSREGWKKSLTAETRRNAAFGGTQGWLRQEVMPGGTSGEVMRRKITGGGDAGACAPG